jgi:hypothetical protein
MPMGWFTGDNCCRMAFVMPSPSQVNLSALIDDLNAMRWWDGVISADGLQTKIRQRWRRSMMGIMLTKNL